MTSLLAAIQIRRTLRRSCTTPMASTWASSSRSLIDPDDSENYHDAPMIIVDANDIAARDNIDDYDHEEEYVEYLANDRD
eukprot:11081724-Heterocapsa_arctica.AAC.1